jgi:hypothetical protein
MEDLTPASVRALLERLDEAEVVSRLVATGSWSEPGAVEIVSFLSSGPDALFDAGVSGRRGAGPIGPDSSRLSAFRAGRRG